MEENVAMVVFDVESEAFQAITELKHESVNDYYTISQMGLVKKQDERIQVLEEYDSGVNTTDDTVTGGLIGSLIGLLGGPLFFLLSSGVGALVGSAVDAGDASKNTSMLEKVSDRLHDGQIALVVLIQESDEAIFNRIIEKFNAEILRWDAATIAAEVDEAKRVEKNMRRVAREELREQKKAERKADIEERRSRIHANIEGFKERHKDKDAGEDPGEVKE